MPTPIPTNTPQSAAQVAATPTLTPVLASTPTSTPEPAHTATPTSTPIPVATATAVVALFGPPNVITTDADFARSVYAVDVDGDGDIDVLSASFSDNKIAWYENTFGDGSSWLPFTITTDIDSATSVYAADMDGDGDIDALSASQLDDKIAWYENTSGDGSSWSTRIITTDAEGAFSVYAADVDGDGDMDALSASIDEDRIAWYENMAQE